MGNGIAQVAAKAGLQVMMVDLAQDQCEAGVATITESLDRLLRKERITSEERDATLARIVTSPMCRRSRARTSWSRQCGEPW